MFETIVWATDGSEHADRALPFVLGLARAHRSKIVAIHADEDREPVDRIESQVEELRDAGHTAELRVVRGDDGIATMLARTAQDVDAQLIVVGTHGHGGSAAALLGNVARGLLHEAHCPVLAVPPVRSPGIPQELSAVSDGVGQPAGRST